MKADTTMTNRTEFANRLSALRAEVRPLPSDRRRAHLSDGDFRDYALEAIPTDRATAMEDHFETCGSCFSLAYPLRMIARELRRAAPDALTRDFMRDLQSRLIGETGEFTAAGIEVTDLVDADTPPALLARVYALLPHLRRQLVAALLGTLDRTDGDARQAALATLRACIFCQDARACAAAREALEELAPKVLAWLDPERRSAVARQASRDIRSLVKGQAQRAAAAPRRQEERLLARVESPDPAIELTIEAALTSEGDLVVRIQSPFRHAQGDLGHFVLRLGSRRYALALKPAFGGWRFAKVEVPKDDLPADISDLEIESPAEPIRGD